MRPIAHARVGRERAAGSVCGSCPERPASPDRWSPFVRVSAPGRPHRVRRRCPFFDRQSPTAPGVLFRGRTDRPPWRSSHNCQYAARVASGRAAPGRRRDRSWVTPRAGAIGQRVAPRRCLASQRFSVRGAMLEARTTLARRCPPTTAATTRSRRSARTPCLIPPSLPHRHSSLQPVSRRPLATGGYLPSEKPQAPHAADAGTGRAEGRPGCPWAWAVPAAAARRRSPANGGITPSSARSPRN